MTRWVDFWDSLARADPFKAVLTRPEHWDEESFFHHGDLELDPVLQAVFHIRPEAEGGSALDFGCGIGRLSRRLRRSFTEVIGVDASGEMISSAIRMNSNRPPITFIQCGENQPLPFSRTFDFIYSCNTLQHIEPTHALQWISHLTSRLKPGGLLVFTVYSGSLSHHPPVVYFTKSASVDIPQRLILYPLLGGGNVVEASGAEYEVAGALIPMYALSTENVLHAILRGGGTCIFSGPTSRFLASLGTGLGYTNVETAFWVCPSRPPQEPQEASR